MLLNCSSRANVVIYISLRSLHSLDNKAKYLFTIHNLFVCFYTNGNTNCTGKTKMIFVNLKSYHYILITVYTKS